MQDAPFVVLYLPGSTDSGFCGFVRSSACSLRCLQIFASNRLEVVVSLEAKFHEKVLFLVKSFRMFFFLAGRSSFVLCMMT